MFYGKSKVLVGRNGVPQYFTRKDRRFIKWSHTCNPGKKNKKVYHKQMRNGKYRLMELKGSQWKRLRPCNLWNWC